MQLSLILSTGGSGVFSQLPAQADIVAKFQYAISSDNTQWIDTNATGDYEVEPALSALFDGASSGGLVDDDGVATSITLVGDFEISTMFILPDVIGNHGIIGGEDTIEGLLRINSTFPQMFIDGTSRNFSGLTIIANPLYRIEIMRVGTTLTCTLVHDGITETQLLSSTTSDLTLRYAGSWGVSGGSDKMLGNLYDIHIADSTGVKLSNFLAQGGDQALCISQVGPDVLWNGYTDSMYEESIEYGHEWENYSEYELSDGIVVGGEDVVGKIPQDPTNLGYDVFGNLLTNPGTPQQNLDVTGYTGAWDGSASGVLGSTITLVADFRIDIISLVESYASHRCIIGGDSTTEGFIRLRSDTFPQVFINATDYTFSGVTLLLDTQYSHTLTRNGTDLTWTATDTSGNIQTETLTCLTNNLIIRYIGKWSVASDEFSGAISLIEIYNASDTLINHWVVESSPTSLQDTIYDIVGGNHATLTGATLPFFTTEMEGSKLFADGFDDVGGSDGLVPAGANSGPLTNTPTEFIGDYCLFDAPLSVSFYDAAVVAGIEDDLYLAGEAIGLTADAWILLASNPLFFGAVKNILVMYNAVQSGDTLDQINDYLGI